MGINENPSVTILITTQDRPGELDITLSRLSPQVRLAKNKIEIIIIDDGSLCELENKEIANNNLYGLSFRIIYQEKHGASVARNRGIKESVGDIIIIIGDDQIPDTGFIDRHVEAHRKFADDARVIVCGYTIWWKELDITPFMKWLDNGGPQYRYGNKRTGWTDMSTFYTSNVSFKRNDLEIVGPFDPDLFPFEDTDYALRAQKLGYHFWFCRESVVQHNHARSIGSYVYRSKEMGSMFRRLAMKHPELIKKYHLHRNNLIVSIVPSGFVERASRTRMRLPGVIYWLILRRAFYEGYLQKPRVDTVSS